MLRFNPHTFGWEFQHSFLCSYDAASDGASGEDADDTDNGGPSDTGGGDDTATHDDTGPVGGTPPSAPEDDTATHDDTGPVGGTPPSAPEDEASDYGGGIGSESDYAAQGYAKGLWGPVPPTSYEYTEYVLNFEPPPEPPKEGPSIGRGSNQSFGGAVHEFQKVSGPLKGALKGFSKAGPFGAVIGAGVNMAVQNLPEELNPLDEIETTIEETIGPEATAALDIASWGAIGLAAFGPVGAAIGLGLGALANMNTNVQDVNENF